MTLMLAAVFAAAATSATVSQPQVRDLGPMTANAPVAISVVLAYRNEAELDRLVASQNDSGSPTYRHWLTSAQFASEFAPTANDYTYVVDTLRRAGFAITQTYSNRTVVDAQAAAAVASRYFDTRIDRVEQPSYGVRYRNVRPLRLPPEWHGLVYTVTGLDDLVYVHPSYARLKGSMRTRQLPAGGPPLFGPVSSTTNAAGYAPLAFALSYDLPNRYSGPDGPYDGKGRAGGILIDANFLDSDIASYLAYFKIARTGKTVRVPIDGGAPKKLTGDSIEATLDVETYAGNAPGADVYVYQTPSLADAHTTSAYNAVVADNRVDAISSSFGGCETFHENAVRGWDHIALQGAALGITFIASSGDAGGVACLPFLVGVSAPASGAHFVAVGGTSLRIDPHTGAYVHETCWNGSGGGISQVFGVPSWQLPTPNIEPYGRNVPDIALDADPATGTAYYITGTWNTQYNPLGGTSLAAPLFGAGLIEVDQYANARAGLAAVKLFNTVRTVGYERDGLTYFHQVSYGDNNIFRCRPGYDQVTGIGTLDFWNQAKAHTL